MQTETTILAPAAVLAGWSMIVFLWLLARRLPAFKAAGVVLGEMPPGHAEETARRKCPPRPIGFLTTTPT